MLSPEQFCDNVVAALQAPAPGGIQAALDAQTSRWATADQAAGRNIVLQAPRAKDYYIGGVPAVLRYPTIEVAVPDLEMDNFSLEDADGDVKPTLMVRALFKQPSSPEALYRMGCRWFAAVITLLADTDTFPELAIRGLSGHWRYDPRTEDADEVTSGVLITLSMEGAMSPFAA